MKLKLRLNRETEESIRQELIRREIEITEETNLILTEERYHAGKLHCRDGNEIVALPFRAICYIESLGHDVLVHTKTAAYKTDLRIYRLEASLPAGDFLRVSSGVIIRRDAIERIRPALSSKFYLTLTNGDMVTVTRTYYYRFKEFYGI